MPRTALLLTAIAAGLVIGGVAWSGIATAAVSSDSSTAADARLVVDLSERRLRAVVDGETVGTYRIAVGKAGHETPTGNFRIARIIWNPSWVPPDSEWARDRRPTPPGDPDNPMGRVKIFFAEPDYYIHGTEAEGSLGTAASHGCLRMKNADVVELARLVMEHGGEKRSPNWFRRVLNRVTDTREVRLSSPVPIRISG